METNFKDPIELKLHILDKYGISEEPKTIDFCREAYKFLVDGDFIKYMGVDANGNHVIERVPPTADGAVMEVQPKDGVYLGYADHIEMFNGHNEKPDDVEFVAFKFGQVSLKVWHKDICDVKMTTDKDEAAMPYITKYADAAHDFSGKARTEDLLARGLKCECEGFNRGWYIPSIGELYVMYLMKDAINEALEYTNRTPIQDTWYWSSTEFSALSAWYLLFDYGRFSYGNGKSYEGSVRPVSAFNPLSF